jgi:hypothetical protein
MRMIHWNYLVENGFKFLLSDRKGSALSSGGDVELCMAFQLAGFDLYYEENLTFYHYMPAGRLSWDYLVRLYGAFGKADPVLNIYSALLHKKGIRRWVHTNIVLSILISLYHFLGYFPYRKHVKPMNSEGSRMVLNFAYLKNSLLEKLRLIFRFHSMVSGIKKAPWFNWGKPVNQSVIYQNTNIPLRFESHGVAQD